MIDGRGAEDEQAGTLQEFERFFHSGKTPAHMGWDLVQFDTSPGEDGAYP